MTIGYKETYDLWNEKEYSYFKKLVSVENILFVLITDPFKKAIQPFIPEKNVNTQNFHTISGDS